MLGTRHPILNAEKKKMKPENRTVNPGSTRIINGLVAIKIGLVLLGLYAVSNESNRQIKKMI